MPGRTLICLEARISGERIARSRAERESRYKTNAAKPSNSHIGSRYKTHAAKLSDNHLGSRYKTNAAKLSNSHFGSRYKTWRTSLQGLSAGGGASGAPAAAHPPVQGFPRVIVANNHPNNHPAGLVPFVPDPHTNRSGDCSGDCSGASYVAVCTRIPHKRVG